MLFSVTILGSNSSVPAYGRHHTAQIVTLGKEKIMIDCGDGTQNQMMKFGLSATKVNKILISHLHGDHYLGLMGVLFTMHLSGRKNDLTIYGPKGLDEIITTQLKYSDTSLNYNLKFHRLNPEKEFELLFENDLYKIHSFPLTHRIPCCGFLIRENDKPRRINKDKIPKSFPLEYFDRLKEGEDIMKDGETLYKNKELTLEPHPSRSYAYCSDTLYMEEIIDKISGADLLYHEATFLHEMGKWADQTFHSTTKQAATIAENAGAKKLLIGHFSARYEDVSPFVDEARSVFPNTFPASEGETFHIEA